MSATFQPDATPPAKTTSGLKIVLIVLAVLGLIGLLICGGFVALVFFGLSQVDEQYRNQLEGNPVLVQEIGELESVDVKITETRADQESGSPQMVMDVTGSEGTGTVVATVAQDGTNRIIAATLETEDGRVVELPIENGAANFNFDELDIDTGEPMQPEAPQEAEAPEPAEAPEAAEAPEPAEAQ